MPCTSSRIFWVTGSTTWSRSVTWAFWDQQGRGVGRVEGKRRLPFGFGTTPWGRQSTGLLDHHIVFYMCLCMQHRNLLLQCPWSSAPTITASNFVGYFILFGSPFLHQISVPPAEMIPISFVVSILLNVCDRYTAISHSHLLKPMKK